MQISTAALLALALVLGACTTTPGPMLTVHSGTVLIHATVVDVRTGALQLDSTVVVEGGTIRRVEAGLRVQASGTARVIDAAGRFVVPGYIDMHTHATPASAQAAVHWPLMLAHGITGVREMSGSPALLQRAAAHNAERAAGRLAAPAVLQMPADIFVGRITDPATATAAVQQHQAQGASFIKIANSNRAVTLALLEEGRRLGLGVSGHLPLSVSSAEASAAGWRSIEHLGAGFGLLLECSRDEAAIRAAIAGGQGARPVMSMQAIVSPLLFRAADAPLITRLLDTYDEGRCRALAQTLARNGTWQVPTLIRLRTAAESGSAAWRGHAQLSYIDAPTAALWETLGQQFAASVPPEATATFQRHVVAQRALVKLLHDHGVKLLTGSDQGGIWVLPGLGLHQEFDELAAAGLTPLQVLQAATVHAAEYLGKTDTLGSVAAGRAADLLLLDADPRADVKNLRRISTLMVAGQVVDAAALAAIRQAAVR